MIVRSKRLNVQRYIMIQPAVEFVTFIIVKLQHPQPKNPTRSTCNHTVILREQKKTNKTIKQHHIDKLTTLLTDFVQHMTLWDYYTYTHRRYLSRSLFLITAAALRGP